MKISVFFLSIFWSASLYSQSIKESKRLSGSAEFSEAIFLKGCIGKHNTLLAIDTLTSEFAKDYNVFFIYLRNRCELGHESQTMVILAFDNSKGHRMNIAGQQCEVKKLEKSEVKSLNLLYKNLEIHGYFEQLSPSKSAEGYQEILLVKENHSLTSGIISDGPVTNGPEADYPSEALVELLKYIRINY